MLSRRSVATGIDLGHYAVKLVRLEGNGARTLTHWGIEEVPPGDPPALKNRAHALASLLRRLDLRPRQLGRVVTAVSGADVHLRQVELPGIDADDVQRALPFEARKHLPLEGVPDPCIDFQILRSTVATGDGATGQEVLLVAAPRGLRDGVLRILADVGVEPDAVDAEPLPAVNAVLDAHPPDLADGEAILLVCLGARTSSIAAVQPEKSLYVRSLGLTGEKLLARLGKDLGIDRDAAREMLVGMTGPDPGPAAGSLRRVLDDLTGELEETVRFLGMRQRGFRLAQVYLCGGVALLCGVRDQLRSALGVEIVCPDPLAGIVSTAGGEPSPQERVRLVSAVGLAKW